MLKKLLLGLAMMIGSLGALAAGPAFSEPENAEGRPMLTAPVTEEDILLFLDYMRRLVDAKGDEERIRSVIGDTGFADPQRLWHVKNKCGSAMGIIRYGESIKGSLPPQVRPTDEEMELVRKYQEDFTELRASLIEMFN